MSDVNVGAVNIGLKFNIGPAIAEMARLKVATASLAATMPAGFDLTAAAAKAMAPAVKAAALEAEKLGNEAKAAASDVGLFDRSMVAATTAGMFLGRALYDLAQNGIRFLVNEFTAAIRLSSEAQAAFLGLGSVARAFGVDVTAARDAARSLSADGLMTVQQSALGLKNLLASGFNLDQAIHMMGAFKDSAAFGRQASLSFGDAVTSATEGIKNQNSILVDNSGVTKNLSLILKEAGFSVQDLGRVSSDAAVRLALYNGIIRETAAQMGDAQKLTETYSGAVSKLDSSWNMVLGTVGAAITQNRTVADAINMASEAVVGLNTNLTHQGAAFGLVSEAVIFATKALSWLMTALDASSRLMATFVAGLSIVLVGATELYATMTQLSAATMGFFADVASVPGSPLTPLKSFFESRAKDLDERRKWLEDWADTFGKQYNAAFDVAHGTTAFQADMQKVKAALAEAHDALGKTRGLTVQVDEAAAAAGRSMGGGLADGAAKAAKHLKEMGPALTDAAKSYLNLVSSLDPGKFAAQIADWADAAAHYGGIQKLNVEQQRTLNKLVTDAISAHAEAGREIPLAWQDTQAATGGPVENLKNLQALMPPITEEMQRLSAAMPPPEMWSWTDDGSRDLLALRAKMNESADAAALAAGKVKSTWSDTVRDLGAAFDDLGRSIGGTFGDIVSGAASAIAAIGNLKHAAGGSGGFVGTATAVAQGAAAVYASTTAGRSTKANVASGAMSGFAAGMNPALLAVTGGWSAAIGPAIGAAVGFAKSRIVGHDEKAARQAFADVQAQILSLATTEQLAAAAGDRWALMNGIIADSFASMGLSGDDALAHINGLLDATHVSAEAVKDALEGVNVALERAAQLKDALAQQKDLKAGILKQAVERYGIAFEAAGSGYQSGNLADRSEELMQFRDALLDSGAQQSVVLTAMAGDFSKLAQDARMAHVELPTELKESIGELINMRLLRDEHGNAYTDVNGFRFGDELKPLFDSMLTKLDELITELKTPIEALRTPGTLPPAPTMPAGMDYLAAQQWLAQNRAVQTMHDGGIIRAHSGWYVGGLRSREVPIIAEEGEGILSAATTSRLGGKATIDHLNGGGGIGGGGGDTHVHVTINAIDGDSVKRFVGSDEFVHAFTTTLRRNTYGLRSDVTKLVVPYEVRSRR